MFSSLYDKKNSFRSGKLNGLFWTYPKYGDAVLCKLCIPNFSKTVTKILLLLDLGCGLVCLPFTLK